MENYTGKSLVQCWLGCAYRRLDFIFWSTLNVDKVIEKKTVLITNINKTASEYYKKNYD